MRAGRKIIDAEFEVVRGPMRVGDPHASRRGWFFSGHFDASGEPIFVRGPGWWARRRKWRQARAWLGDMYAVAYAGFGAIALLVLIGSALGVIDLDRGSTENAAQGPVATLTPP